MLGRTDQIRISTLVWHRLVATMLRPYTWILDTLLLRLSDRKRIEGFDVYVVPTGDPPDAVFQKVREGLVFLRSVDARRFERTQRDLACIVVRPCARSHYVIRSNSCVLDRTLALKQSPEKIAMTVLHEATHARIYHAGIPWVNNALKNRIERLCTKAELSFLYQLSAAGYAVPSARIEAMRSFIATGETPALWKLGWEVWEQQRKAMRADTLP